MPIPELLRTLLTTTGPSGYEAAPAAAWRAAAEGFADEVSVDVMGSSTARVRGTGGGPTLVVVGHIDEIGLVVTHIDDDGFLYFLGIGGWDAQILIGQRVEVTTREGVIPGVIGKKPIHLLSPDDRDKAGKVKDLHIDVGARDGDEARSLVRLGDSVVLAGDPVELPNNRAVSRSMDNRLGCFVALEAARLVKEAGGAPGDLVAAAVVQEEITFGGAQTMGFSLQPDLAIVVDVTHATDAPGVEMRELGKHDLGSGPVIERGSVLHPQIFELLHDTAEAEAIPFTVQASAGRTGTDADALHLSRGGVPCGGVSLPLRYMHSPVEMVQLDDVENAAKLIAALAQRLEPGLKLER